MWCPTCRADVAAELAADSRRFLCARCRTELGLAAAELRAAPPAAAATERAARELLARWSAPTLLEPTAPAAAPPAAAAPRETQEAPAAAAPPRPPRRRRLDRPHPLPSELESRVPDAPVPPPRRRERPDAPATLPLPLGDLSADDPPRKRTSWAVVAGQLCAYVGIGLLTCGAVLVLWSYYGGPAGYAPSGWLMTTLGQMLLFLGGVTLVSAGLEQTTAEVTRRIDRLGDRLLRFEAAHLAAGLRPPHYLKRRSRRGDRTNDGETADAA